MKKPAAFILAALGTLSVNSWAGPSDLYVGLDVFGSNNDFHLDYAGISDNYTTDGSGFKVKLGVLLQNDLRLQGYLLSEKFDDSPFLGSNERLGEIGLDLIKEFIISPSLSPFIQGGVGFGGMDLDSYYYSDDSVGEVNLKVGLGLMVRVTPVLELLGGLDFQWRQWGDVTEYDPGYGYYTLETEDDSRRFRQSKNKEDE
jgi:hypothetical protein